MQLIHYSSELCQEDLLNMQPSRMTCMETNSWLSSIYYYSGGRRLCLNLSPCKVKACNVLYGARTLCFTSYSKSQIKLNGVHSLEYRSPVKMVVKIVKVLRLTLVDHKLSGMEFICRCSCSSRDQTILWMSVFEPQQRPKCCCNRLEKPCFQPCPLLKMPLAM